MRWRSLIGQIGTYSNHMGGRALEERGIERERIEGERERERRIERVERERRI